MKLAGGLLAALVVGLIFILPVHISQTSRSDAVVIAGGTIAPPPERTGPQRWTVEVGLVAGSAVVVEGLRDGYGVPVAAPAPMGWTVVETGMTGADPASPLVIDASLRQLGFSLRSVDGAPSTVQVSVDGRPVEQVTIAGPEPVSIQVNSGVSVETTTRRYGLGAIDIGAGAGVEVAAWLGPIPLPVVEGNDGTAVIPARAVPLAVADGLMATANVITVGLVLIAAFLGFGWAMLARGIDDTDPSLAVAVGAAVPALALGALNYVAPVRLAAPIVAVSMGALIVWRLVGERSGDRLAASRRLLGRASIGWPVLIAVAFVGVPAALTHNTNLGMLQTDIFDYLGVQETYWSSNIVASGLDWGDGLRSIDSSVRSATIGWTHLSPRQGFTAVRFISVVVALLTVGGAARALGARRSVVVLIQFGVVSVASVTSLWVEGYLSRELFIWIVVPTVTAPMLVIGRQGEGEGANEHDGRNWLALGAIFAWPAALVPPFMVTLLIPAVGLLAASRSEGLATARRRGLLFSAAFLGLLVANSRWIFNIEKANDYANGVENIGKTFVVPFHGDPEFPAAAIGLTGFHTNPLSWQGPRVLDGFGRPVEAALRLSNGAASSWTVIVLALVGLGLAGVMIWAQAEAATRSRVAGLLATPFVVAIAVPVLMDTSWESQSFFVLMWVWTMSALLLIPIIVGAAALRGRTGALVAIPLIILGLFNLGSSMLEMTMWFSHPQAEGTIYHHYDAAADLLAVEQLVDRGELTPGGFVVDRPISLTARNDDDRVLFNHLARELQRDGSVCLNCVRDGRNGSVASIDAELPADVGRVLILGANSCGEGESLYEGVLVALCGTAAEANDGAESTAAGRD